MIVQLAAAALALATAPTTATLRAAGGGEVSVSAKEFKYVFPKQRIEYTGNPVRLTRGDATLACLKLVAQLDKAGEISDATCQGEVRFERADKVVTCEKAVYQAAASRLTCEGKPSIRSGAMTARGSLLVYDLDADEVTMENPEGNVPGAQADQRLHELQEKRKQKHGGQK